MSGRWLRLFELGCLLTVAVANLGGHSANAQTAVAPSPTAPAARADAIVTSAGPTGIPIPPPRPTWQRRPATGKTLRVPEEHATLTAAMQAARHGDTLAIGPGDFRELLVIDKSITFRGAGFDKTRLFGLDKTREGDSAITVRPGVDVAVEQLTVTDCDRGIFVDPAGRLSLTDCHILNNTRDGVYMEQGTGDVHTYLWMERCRVSGTADGVDFMGGQGYVIDCMFADNSDDGVDVDGDTGIVVYNCRFENNRDDGIEVRLRQRTYVFAVDNEFRNCGEDGFEVIDTYLPQHGIFNVISLQRNRFHDSRRYAIGLVDQKTEQDGTRPVSSAFFLGGNEYHGSGTADITPNYRNAWELAQRTPAVVQVTLGEGAVAKQSTHPLQRPLLVGVYDFKAMTDGSGCQDAEDVCVSPTKVYVPDDDAKSIYVVDRMNGDLLHKIPMSPIRGSMVHAKGPEGVHVVVGNDGDEQLWVIDDDGTAVYRLSLKPETYGHLLERQSTVKLGACEGLAVLGETMFVTRNNGLAMLPTAAAEKPVRPTVRISSDRFGAHVAGVGIDPSGTRLFASTNGYHSHEDWRVSWRGRDKPSGIYELSTDLATVNNVWDIGPFCDDARGVAFRDGLLYAACGRQPYRDPKTGEEVRNGEKVFVFLVDPDLQSGPSLAAMKRAIPHLPLRCGH